MEAMILFLFYLICCSVLATFAFRAGVASTGGNFLPFLKPKKLPIDYNYIAQQDKEVFGIDVSIEELPGYKWRVRTDTVGDINVCLLNEEGHGIRSGWVFISRIDDGNLESAVEARMKKLVDEVIADNKKKEILQNIINKYNNQPVKEL
jgi:hypothetical protein